MQPFTFALRDLEILLPYQDYVNKGNQEKEHGGTHRQLKKQKLRTPKFADQS